MTSHDDGTQPVAASNDAVGSAIGKMSQGEKLFGLGAVILVAVDLIGGLLAEDYYMGTVLWGLAGLGLAALYFNRMRNRTTPVRYEWVLAVIGLSAAVLGARILLGDVTNNLFDRGGGTILFALLTYAGAALMGVGGYQASKS